MSTWRWNKQGVAAWARIKWKAEKYWGIEAIAQRKGLAIVDERWRNSKVKAK